MRFMVVYTVDGSWETTSDVLVEAHSEDDVDTEIRDVIRKGGGLAYFNPDHLDDEQIEKDLTEMIENNWYYIRALEDCDITLS